MITEEIRGFEVERFKTSYVHINPPTTFVVKQFVSKNIREPCIGTPPPINLSSVRVFEHG